MQDKLEKQFYIHSQAYYHESSPLVEDAIDEIMINLYAPDGGLDAEFGVRWYRLGAETAARLEVFDEAWVALAALPELIAYLAENADRTVSVEEFAAALIKLGFHDATQRTAPGADAKQAIRKRALAKLTAEEREALDL